MNTNIEALVRPAIKKLDAYSSARHEFTGVASIFLDANENPFYNGVNRYPDAAHTDLKRLVSEKKSISAENIFLGNGSDEAIDILMRIFASPGRDAIMQFSPTYGMYAVLAQINDLQMIDVPLNADFQLDVERIKSTYTQNRQIKLIFICSPNNPTGNLINVRDIESILADFEGVVVIDEAYLDFADALSFSSVLHKFPNLVVLQTLSKAYGMAGLRVGMAFAASTIIGYMNKVKYPYNISLLNQVKAIEILRKSDLQNFVADLKSERAKLFAFFENKSWITKLYPSDANFIFFTTKFDAMLLYRFLLHKGIVIRNRQAQFKNALRITVGTPAENKRLVATILDFEKELLMELNLEI